jgi:uncharacterized FAD-dependent dehydrogenase
LQNTVLWLESKKYRTKAWHLAGETQRVPAQRMIDFTQSRVFRNSENIIRSWDFRRNGTTVSWILNSNIAEGFLEFGKSMKGYLTNEAILHAQNQEPLRLFVFPEIL